MLFWLIIGVGLGYFFHKQIDVYVKKGVKYLRDRSGSDNDKTY
jgi:predicted porin